MRDAEHRTDVRPGRATQTSGPQRLALLAAAIVLALALLELALRMGGWAFLWLQERRNQASLGGEHAYRILCIGESTTAMGGKNAYPYQLEHVLNEQAGRPMVSVINGGVPATSTTAILARLPAMLDEYRPDAVVAMMGANDGDEGTGRGNLGSALRSLRVSKLAVFAWELLRGQHSRSKPPTSDASGPLQPARGRGAIGPVASAEAARAKERRLLERVAASLADVPAHVELGTLYLVQGRLDQARPLLERALTLAPGDEPALLGLALIERRQGASQSPEKPEPAALPGVATHPAVAEDYFTLFHESELARSLTTHLMAAFASDDAAYRMLGNAYFAVAGRCMREGRLDEAEQLLESGIRLPGHRTRELYHGWHALIARARGDERAYEQHRARARALRRQHEDAHTATARNYRAIRALLRKRGVRLFAVQYPLRDVESLRRMLRDDAGVVFVDNEAPFQEALRSAPYEEYFIDAFAGEFGHMTPRGNRLLAETIAQVIRRELLAPASAAATGP